ncbi:MAD2L1-binding protein-like isoform X2 [Denticeps clupeoides]|uniref:MAD2L1-binding protein-like isoform X2 n=1 Tax=Denticeps clupeoides TaxID=299321 RepID=UPI0010A44513|nr:MAD2L1-binding protein-like isoform X2 [Denticeps clupeoides]
MPFDKYDKEIGVVENNATRTAAGRVEPAQDQVPASDPSDPVSPNRVPCERTAGTDDKENSECDAEAFRPKVDPAHSMKTLHASMHLQRQASDEEKELVHRAKEECMVDVVFPGRVTKEGCCRFVCEILKCVLYQRQQLPMTYDQLVYHQKQQQASSQSEEIVAWRPLRAAGEWDWRKCHRTLQAVEEVLTHLEILFSLSLVPRVLLMLGGSVLLPKELYELNMEDVSLGTGDCSLRTSVCLRQLFRALFVADILPDARPVRLMTTTVMALAHRDCGVTGFCPKMNFRVPVRVKKQVIRLSCDRSVARAMLEHPSDWADYVWFQAPVNIKGFCK